MGKVVYVLEKCTRVGLGRSDWKTIFGNWDYRVEIRWWTPGPYLRACLRDCPSAYRLQPKQKNEQHAFCYSRYRGVGLADQQFGTGKGLSQE